MRPLGKIAGKTAASVLSFAILTLLVAPVLAAATALPSADDAVGTPEVHAANTDTVVLLHGLGRSAGSMDTMAEALREKGYEVFNEGYPSRDSDVNTLAAVIHERLQVCCQPDGGKLHFVTHSMGGIVLRALVAQHRPQHLGRAVMLAPPNAGTEIVDTMGENPLFELALGPGAGELGTDDNAAPIRLGPVDFPVGVVAGDRSWNPIGSWMIPGQDDGTVSVDSTKLKGMSDHIVVDSAHTFIMNDATVIAQTLHFLESGSFQNTKSMKH